MTKVWFLLSMFNYNVAILPESWQEENCQNEIKLLHDISLRSCPSFQIFNPADTGKMSLFFSIYVFMYQNIIPNQIP